MNISHSLIVLFVLAAFAAGMSAQDAPPSGDPPSEAVPADEPPAETEAAPKPHAREWRPHRKPSEPIADDDRPYRFGAEAFYSYYERRLYFLESIDRDVARQTGFFKTEVYEPGVTGLAEFYRTRLALSWTGSQGLTTRDVDYGAFAGHIDVDVWEFKRTLTDLNGINVAFDHDSTRVKRTGDKEEFYRSRTDAFSALYFYQLGEDPQIAQRTEVGLYGKYWFGLGSGAFKYETETDTSGGRQFIESRAFYPMPKIGFDVEIGGPGMDDLYFNWKIDSLFGYFIPASSSKGDKNTLFFVELNTNGGATWKALDWLTLSLTLSYHFTQPTSRDRGDYDEYVTFVSQRFFTQLRVSLVF